MTYKVGVIGCGNWGTTVSKIIGENVLNSSDYEHVVKMWVMEEVFEGTKLTEIINTAHENKKYLPGIKLPPNVVAYPDLKDVVSGSTHLVFVIPHQFLVSTCEKITKMVEKGAVGISLSKGFIDDPHELVLASSVIRRILNIHVSVLSGANIANEIAAEKFSTTTIGCDKSEIAAQWKFLFTKPYFRVDVIPHTIPMEIFGSLKNCIALGIGFIEALGFGNNAKATALRIGYTEIMKFSMIFQPDCSKDMFLQSFGLDDLIATCFGGRNVRAAEVFIRTKKTMEEIEKEVLNGQKLQGPGTIITVHNILKSSSRQSEFPFLEYIYKVLNENAPASSILAVLN